MAKRYVLTLYSDVYEKSVVNEFHRCHCDEKFNIRYFDPFKREPDVNTDTEYICDKCHCTYNESQFALLDDILDMLYAPDPTPDVEILIKRRE